ncbi:MAG: thioesterase family protein [Candidatus Heimdallarchaeota archaeon]|nr:thioesterase family protein [Candidatus Heimdallarchaeota archaeon]
MKSLDFEVTKEYTAAHIGSGSISVLATPSMILFMEIASGMLAHDHIPQGYTSVGTRVCVDHLDAVLEGNTVQVISVIAGIDKRKIIFDVEVKHKDRVIGKGTHIRFIVNEERFLEKLKE